MRLDQAIGARVKHVREARGLSQEELAERLRVEGLPWSRSVIAALESGRRELAVGDLVLLTVALTERGRAEPELLPLDGTVEIAQAKNFPAERVRAALAGTLTAWLLHPQDARGQGHLEPDPTRSERQWRERLEEPTRHVARKLDSHPLVISRTAHELWGRGFMAERDARVSSDPRSDDPRVRRALRGHTSRALARELAERLGPDRDEMPETGDDVGARATKEADRRGGPAQGRLHRAVEGRR
ncbi:MAG: helix-turn-helix transcriptional regulator [Actinomycetota bacterium]